jgi:CubicO group peptidase (beta-lactamase class C family)
MGGFLCCAADGARTFRAAAVNPFALAGSLLSDAVSAHAFPAACVEAGTHDRVLWSAAFGALTYDSSSPPTTPATIFDLASLTKVIATTTIAMRSVDSGMLRLDDPVRQWVSDWRGEDRAEVTIRDLLAHCSGLTGYMPFFRDFTGRPEFQNAICALPLEYVPRTRSIYSDLGFILLGFILEDADARRRALRGTPGTSDPAASLSAQFQRIASFFTSEPIAFKPPRAWRDRIAPTEVDSWRGRLLVGEVHDENAWALGGVAGHAGLFGTAAAVGAFARAVLLTLTGEPILARADTFREFITRTSIAGSSRALGWDTMLPTSSCGTKLSRSSIGHTGFTGTSLWIDWERDLYIVLLTNRVHPQRSNDAIREVRPAVHDAIVDAVPG